MDRVLIEVQDECGGLPEGQSAELFHPFEQRGSDRTGLGLGLAYSQWAIVANGGRIYVRNLPASGCVFIADLPRCLDRDETDQTLVPASAGETDGTAREVLSDARLFVAHLPGKPFVLPPLADVSHRRKIR